jgi:hypothetical protein
MSGQLIGVGFGIAACCVGQPLGCVEGIGYIKVLALPEVASLIVGAVVLA